MYLVPKNIKVKREVFKGFGMGELLVLACSFGLGFLLQSLTQEFHIKVFLFFSFPLATFLLFLPLPNGSTPLVIFKKFLLFIHNQKQYKYK